MSRSNGDTGIELSSSTGGFQSGDMVLADARTASDAVPTEMQIDCTQAANRSGFSWKRLLAFAGPGLLMSIAYVDPGNLESDLQQGAQTGYMLGWVTLWSTALGFLVQLLAVRLGIVTSKHLAQHCRDVYPVVPRIALWLMVEIAIIGSDIQEVIGSAIAIRLLTHGAVPLWAGVLITGVDTFFLLFLERLGARKLEAFFGVLVATMTVSFGVMYVQAECPTGEVIFGTVVPRIRSRDLSIATGVVGSLVMPHNIFLHSALVQSRKIDMSHHEAKQEAILYNAIESGVSLSITVLINLFVMAVFAVGFYGTPVADSVGLSSAGEYLGNKFGGLSRNIWAIGLFAAGQSSTMTGTYTGQFVMSGFMELKVSPWKRALITRSMALLPTLAFAFAYAGTSKMDTVNQDLNVLQSFQLPFALIPVLYMSTRGDLMGSFVTRSSFKYAVQGVCAALLVLNLSTAVMAAFASSGGSATGGTLVAAVLTVYFLFVLYLLVGPRKLHALLRDWDSAFAWRLIGWLARAKPTVDEANGHGGICDSDEQPLVANGLGPGRAAQAEPDVLDAA